MPDVRWFIKKKTVKAMTSALLGGPAPYLKGAVVSAFPSGIKLARESVPVVSGAAQVDLTAKDLVEASNEDRLRMQTQLALTFRSQPDVINVELRANQDLVRVEDNGTGPASGPRQERPGPPDRRQQQRTGPVREQQALAASGHPVRRGPLAPGAGGVARVAGGRVPQRRPRPRLYSIVPGQPARALTTRAGLSRPSFDRYDWVWTAGPGASGATEVVAYRPVGVARGRQRAQP